MNKFGVFLILLGIAVPLICAAFASNYQPDAGVMKNIQKMDLKITLGGKESFLSKFKNFKKAKKVAIPYNYIFTSGVIVAFAGIYFVVIYHRKTKG